jgi:hypothetical protein
MENLQEQNDQTPEPEKPQEPQNNMNQPEAADKIDWDTFDLDMPRKSSYPGEKEKDPFVMFDAYVPTIPKPERRGGRRKYTEAELYRRQGWRLKFKHDKNGEWRYFVILWGNEMTFHFSFKEYEAHQLEHVGNGTHNPFKVFEWAVDFYQERMGKYSYKHSIEELREEFRLFNNPDLANDIPSI